MVQGGELLTERGQRKFLSSAHLRFGMVKILATAGVGNKRGLMGGENKVSRWPSRSGEKPG